MTRKLTIGGHKVPCMGCGRNAKGIYEYKDRCGAYCTKCLKKKELFKAIDIWYKEPIVGSTYPYNLMSYMNGVVDPLEDIALCKEEEGLWICPCIGMCLSDEAFEFDTPGLRRIEKEEKE